LGIAFLFAGIGVPAVDGILDLKDRAVSGEEQVTK